MNDRSTPALAEAGAPPAGARPAVTVLMPFYQRVHYFEAYLQQGQWDDLDVQLVCDGSPPEVEAHARRLAAAHPGARIAVHAYAPNRGVAYARAEGARQVRTPYSAFCDDDDFLVDASPYLGAAEAALAQPDTLFVAMPFVFAFNEALAFGLQYDRRPFHERTGLELLSFLVETGEMRLLLSGSVFRTEDLRAVPAEAFFKVSEDYVMLARLCARHPHRRIRVMEQGRFMRLLHGGSLSARHRFSLDKALMNLVSMAVGAFYLIDLGRLERDAFAEILRRRGAVLQASYGLGAGAGAALAALMTGEEPPDVPEAAETLAFLQANAAELPPEFLVLLQRPVRPVAA